MGNRIPLTQLATRLRPALQEMTPGYRRLYFMGLDGCFALQSEAGTRGYFILEDELPAVTEAIRAVVNKRSLAAA